MSKVPNLTFPLDPCPTWRTDSIPTRDDARNFPHSSSFSGLRNSSSNPGINANGCRWLCCLQLAQRVDSLLRVLGVQNPLDPQVERCMYTLWLLRLFFLQCSTFGQSSSLVIWGLKMCCKQRNQELSCTRIRTPLRKKPIQILTSNTLFVVVGCYSGVSSFMFGPTVMSLPQLQSSCGGLGASQLEVVYESDLQTCNLSFTNRDL